MPIEAVERGQPKEYSRWGTVTIYSVMANDKVVYAGKSKKKAEEELERLLREKKHVNVYMAKTMKTRYTLL